MAEKKGFFSRLVAGLKKTRDNIVSGMDSVFHGFSKIDDEFYEELEEILIMGDLGVRATEEILDNLKEKVKENHVCQPSGSSVPVICRGGSLCRPAEGMEIRAEIQYAGHASSHDHRGFYKSCL